MEAEGAVESVESEGLVRSVRWLESVGSMESVGRDGSASRAMLSKGWAEFSKGRGEGADARGAGSEARDGSAEPRGGVPDARGVPEPRAGSAAEVSEVWGSVGSLCGFMARRSRGRPSLRDPCG